MIPVDIHPRKGFLQILHTFVEVLLPGTGPGISVKALAQRIAFPAPYDDAGDMNWSYLPPAHLALAAFCHHGCGSVRPPRPEHERGGLDCHDKRLVGVAAAVSHDHSRAGKTHMPVCRERERKGSRDWGEV